jgi:16S rRNA (cytosine967-C5)-methyltransferase
MPVDALPGFADGTFSVQDEGAQLAAVLVDPQPGERVLDACAAPGGKTLHLAERAPGIELVALDVEPRRLERVRENLERGGVDARLEAVDATDAQALAALGTFDRVLIDAPCTATGILRRQPDVRLLREPGDGARLAAVQRALLEAIWPRLRGGGTLVFCTCSVLPEEGEMVVRAFVDAHPDAVVDTIDADWGRPAGPGRQLLPTADAHDGFFYARLRRDD